MERKDPLVSSWFGIEFQEKVIVAAFRECTGLGSETEVVESKECGQGSKFFHRKVPGRTSFTKITLKSGVTDNMEMWKWRKLVEDGNMKEARRDGSLVMYNQQGQPIARWSFFQAWPNKITGPAAQAGSNEIAVEELEISHERYERIN